MDSRQAYRDMQKLEAMRMEEEARRLEKRRRMEDLQRYQAQQRAAERQKDLCDRITRHDNLFGVLRLTPGIHNEGIIDRRTNDGIDACRLYLV